MLSNIDTTSTPPAGHLYNRYGGVGTLQNYHRFRAVDFQHEAVGGVASCAVDSVALREVLAFSAIDLTVGAGSAAQLADYEALSDAVLATPGVLAAPNGLITTAPGQELLAIARAAASTAGDENTVWDAVRAATAATREVDAFLAVSGTVANLESTAVAQAASYNMITKTSQAAIAINAYAAAASLLPGATALSVFNAVQRSGYNAHPTTSGNCARVEVRRHTPAVDRITITAHGIAIYNDFPAAFYGSYQPFTYGGHNFQTPEDSGVHLITFCLYPNSYQPSGHINLSRAREFYLRYTSSAISNATPADMIVLGSAINFLLISDGSAVLRYTT